jgi:hypothetical protein
MPSAKAVPPFRVSPSVIARYFFHDCERFLRYSAATPEQRRREGTPAPEFDQSPLVEAILASGYCWEQEVLQTHLKGRVVIAPGAGELHTRRLPPARTLRCLRTEPAGRFLYQPTLVPPPRFYETFGIDPALVTVSDNHPDLVAVLPDPGGGRLLRVIDLKRGEALRLTHRVQILFYALELQALLDSEGIADARVDLDSGAVWLGKQPQADLFRLGDFRPHLERFLRHDLGRILAGTARDAHWHLYDRCEWCEFFGPCRDEMRRTDNVSRLAQLTPYGKRHLREQAGVRTLTELGRFLRRADADEVLDRCASLAGQRHRLEARVAALQTDEPRLHGAFAPDLPQGENVAVFSPSNENHWASTSTWPACTSPPARTCGRPCSRPRRPGSWSARPASSAPPCGWPGGPKRSAKSAAAWSRSWTTCCAASTITTSGKKSGRIS